MDIHCFGTGFKMASRFATVSKDETTNTKKRQNLACWCLQVGRKICHKIINKMIPKTLSIEMINKPKQNDVFYLQKVRFWFYPTDLVNTETTIPLRVGS